MQHRPRALVIGGSISGLLAAHLLRDIGWDAIVFERNAVNLTGRGAGISTQIQFRDIMRRIDIPFDDSMGIPVETLICLDRNGNTVLKQPTLQNHERMVAALRRTFGSLAD